MELAFERGALDEEVVDEELAAYGDVDHGWLGGGQVVGCHAGAYVRGVRTAGRPLVGQLDAVVQRVRIFGRHGHLGVRVGCGFGAARVVVAASGGKQEEQRGYRKNPKFLHK